MSRFRRRVCRAAAFAIVALALLGAPTASSAQRCPASSRHDAGRACVELAISNGHLTTRSMVLSRGAIPAAIDDASVRRRLDEALHSIGPVFLLAFQPEDRAGMDKKLGDASTIALRAGQHDWAAYAAALVEWAESHEADVVSIFDRLGAELGLLRERTPFNIVDESLNTESGTVQFDVFVLEKDLAIELPGVKNPEGRVASLRRWLRPMWGQLREPLAIAVRLRDYYQLLKLEPDITVDAAGPIRVIEGRRIARITLPLGITAGERARLLYSVLPDAAFRAFRKHPPQVLAADDQFEAWDYTRHLGVQEGTEPYVRGDELQLYQLALAESGFVLSPVPNTTRAALSPHYVDIEINRPDEKEAPVRAPEAAPALSDASGLIAGQREEAERPTAFVTENDRPRRHNNYIGGGVLYAPDQGTTYLVVAQRQRLPGNASAGVRLAIRESKIDPSFNYFADYIAFPRLGRRLSLQVNGAADTRVRRFLGARFVDEERKGGFARTELELFRDRRGNLLRFSGEARLARIALVEGDERQSEVDMTTLDFGAVFHHRTDESLRPWRVKFEPLVRFGAPEGGSSFTRLSGDSFLHLAAGGGIELDLSARAVISSSSTPIFEQPAIGGADSVRGFRVDDGVGRHAFSAQSELWFPVPLVGSRSGGFLKRSIRLAVFGDLGKVFSTEGPAATGLLRGAGAGARVLVNPVVLKADYAWGWGEAASTRPRRGFYFTVQTNLPF